MNAKTLFLSGLTLAAVVGVAVTAPTIDPTIYEVTAAPKSVLVTFYDGPDTRGFAWETDTSVSETKLWLVEGSHTSAESALFDAATPVDGTYVDRTQGSSPAKTVRCHKAHATGLVSGTTYSYRVGGSGNYAYGTFKVDTAAGARTILYIGDSQVNYTPSFFVWENTVQRAAEILPAAETDLVLFGGDMFDVYATSISAYNYLKWGATVDSATPYYPGVPWSLSSGNHDLDKSGYTYYADLTGVNYQTPSCHSYDFGAAHIAVLPFYSVSDVANVQAVAAWTEADLKAANAAGKTKWNVVMMHLGPYTTGDHGMNESSSIVQLFCPIFSSNHVDLVLQAHDHTYSKTLPYKWNTVGYTTTRTDATIVNTVPAQTKIGGETYDANPAGTYYVCTGCSGPRVYEGEGAYAFLDGAQSYDTHRTYKVAAGTISVDSAYGKKGDDASSELRAAMFGVLKVDETTLTYDWYAVNTNGLEAAVLYDTLRIAKGNTFRVTPYVQRPTTNAVSLLWLAQTNGNASVSWWEQGGATTNAIASATEIAPTDRVAGTRFTAEGVLQYCVAPELAYTNSVEAADNYPDYTREGVGASHEGAGWAMPYTVPYQYRVRLTGLKADTLYGYRVTLENGASYEKTFRTAPAAWRPIRFAYFSDSETEPKDNPLSTGRTSDWTSQTDASKDRIYYATQTEAYATNVARVVEFDPDFIVMAGDLAQKGSRQLDWDEFWRHNAGLLNDPAGSRPIFASPGNHDYWSYYDGGEAGMKKYLSYFEFEPNGTSVDADIQERFHRVDYGVATFLFMDANNGDDNADGEKDTNMYLKRTASGYSSYSDSQIKAYCRAPDFNEGSPQYQWLETQLADAQQKSAFIFVVCHQCPYSVGDHGRPNGTGGERLSGRPLRVLETLFHKYGVTAWLCGHDEMMERSTVTGTETCLDGTTREHTLQIWDMGIAGDGLRGGMKIENPQQQYRAYVNSIEQYDAQGFQTDGGVHYGHLEVTITNRADGAWVATFDPVYEFFTTNAAGQAVFGGTRHYGDKLSVVNTDWIPSVCTWTGAGDGTSWNDAANWDAAGKPENGDAVVLSGQAAGATLVNDIAGLTSLSKITLTGANSFSVSGNALSLAAEDSLAAGPAAGVTYTFAIPLSLDSPSGTNVLTKTGSGELNVTGKLSGDGALRLALGYGNISRGNNSYSGNIVRLGGANDYAGGTDIVNGGCMLILDNATALGSARAVHYGGNNSNAYVAFTKAGPYCYDFVFTSTSKDHMPKFFAIYGGTTTVDGGLTADIAYSNEVRFVGLTNTRSLKFKKKIVAPGLALFSGMTYTAYLTFEEGIDVRQWTIDTDSHGNSSGFNRLYGTDNHCEKFIMGYGSLLCAAENVLDSADFAWTGYRPSGKSHYYWDSLYLEGFDQTVGTISGNSASGSACGVYSTSGTPTLTERAKASATAYLMLCDHISFVYDPEVEGLVQNFTNRTHTTDGTITVKGGTLAFTGDTLLQYVPSITVEEDAAFVLSTTQISALLGLTALTLGTNATFTVAASDGDPFKTENVILRMEESSRIGIPEGLSISVRELWIDGVRQEGGATISGIPQITGGGSIRTAEAEVETKPVTWTAAGADTRISTLANWTPSTTLADLTAGGLLPTFGNGGDEAIVDCAAKTVGISFNRAFTLKAADASASLLVKDSGFTFADGTYAVTNEVATKVKFDQTWDLSDASGVEFVQKGDVSSDSAFSITKSGAGTLRFTGDNTGFSGDFKATEGFVYLEGSSNGLGGAVGAAKAEFDSPARLRLAGCTEERPILLHNDSNHSQSLRILSGTNVLNGALTTDTAPFTPNFSEGSPVLRTNGKVDPSNYNIYVYGYGTWHIAGPLVIGYFGIYDYMKVIFDSPKVTTCTGGSAYLYLSNSRTSVRFDRPMQLDYVYHSLELHSTGCRIDLNGNDQHIGTLKTSRDLIRASGYPEPYIGSSSGPATLYIEQFQKEDNLATYTNSVVNFTGHLSICRMGNYTHQFTLNRAVDTDGALVVSNGLFEITAKGSWRNGTRVAVANAGKVSLGQSRTFSKSAVFTADGQGQFVLNDGVCQRCAELWVGGVKMPSGTYGATGSGAQHVDDVHFAGTGVLDVGRRGVVLILR